MEYIERLEKILNDLENNSGKLAEVPEITKSVKELIALFQESGDAIVQSTTALRKNEQQLREGLEELRGVLKKEQESKDELINTVRTALTSNNKEQLDAVNSINTIISNKISVVESNLTAKTTEIDNGIKRVESKSSENSVKLDGTISGIEKVEEKVRSYGDTISSDTGELKMIIPLIKRIQIISIAAAVFALVACILSIVM